MYISSILALLILFSIHHFLTKSIFYKTFFQKRFGEEIGQARMILFNRLLGAFLFGVVPTIIMLFGFNKSLGSFGITIKMNLFGLVTFLIFGIVAVTVNFFAARKPDNLAMYPQIRTKIWSKSLLVSSALAWLLYLVGYEIMFRGFLFNACLIELGLWPAILINIALYSITHIPKGYKEALGSIPMGIILCLVVYYSGSILPVILIHASLSLSNEWFSIKYNPLITIRK